MIQNAPQRPAYKQGYGESCSRACCEATKAASSGRCKHPGAHSVIVVSSWDKTAASSLLPEPTTGWRTSPEVCPSQHCRQRALQHPRIASAGGAARGGEQSAPSNGLRVSSQHEKLPSGASSTCCRNRAVTGTCNEFINGELVFGKYTLCCALVPGSESIQEARSNLQAVRLEAHCCHCLHAKASSIWQRDRSAQSLHRGLTWVLWVQHSCWGPAGGRGGSSEIRARWRPCISSLCRRRR